jgi:uncharacterized glyoxalase superfamily protein PhnB
MDASIIADISELAVMQPIVAELTVKDLQKSINWYKELGFVVELEGVRDEQGLQWVSMNRNRRSVWLLREDISRHDAGDRCGLTFYLQVEDVDKVYRHLTSKGIKIQDEPGNRWYGLREFVVYDPDGFCWAINHTIPPDQCPPRPTK